MEVIKADALKPHLHVLDTQHKQKEKGMIKQITSNTIILAIAMVTTLAYGQGVVIDGFHNNGTLSWSNSLPNVSSFRVEWAPTLTGQWSSTWADLVSIPGTQQTYTVCVPMFYRVVGDTTPALYWTQNAPATGTSTIWRAIGDYQEPRELLRVPSDAASIVVDPINNRLYWSQGTLSSSGSIWRADLDCSNPEQIVIMDRGWLAIPHLVLDTQRGTIYWAQGDIYRANTDGTAKEVVVSATSPEGVAVDSDAAVLFWGETLGKAIWRADLDGTARQAIVTNGIGQLSGLALDSTNHRLYWADFALGAIGSANYDGSDIQTVVTNILAAHGPYSLSIDPQNRKIYWSVINDSISRANLDGSNVELIVTNNSPFACTVLP